MLSHFSLVELFVTLRTVAPQASLSMGILQARILEWVVLPSSPPGDLPDPGTALASLSSSSLAREFLTTSTTWEAQSVLWALLNNRPAYLYLYVLAPDLHIFFSTIISHS